jgi:hypothetical protein
LEAVSVLAKHKFDATVIFIAYDQEEERSNGWGQGSQFFAASAKASGADIRGAVVMDMIAFNGGGNVAVVGQSDSSSTTPSAALAGKIAQAFGSYTTLTSRRMTGFDDTDGYRLYQAGFPSATVIEQLDANGDLLNPYYHEASDYYRSTSGQPQKYNGRDYLDFVYATEMTKGTVAWAASAAIVLDGTTALAEIAPAIALQQSDTAGGGQRAWLAGLLSVSRADRISADDAGPHVAAPYSTVQASPASQAAPFVDRDAMPEIYRSGSLTAGRVAARSIFSRFLAATWPLTDTSSGAAPARSVLMRTLPEILPGESPARNSTAITAP